jgi:pimeloyl-ACP methyl ester carboxylesterase
MLRRIGHVVIESVAAETPKFTAPMVLVHGLWCTAAVWRRFMGYCAHRGWSCHALRLRAHGATGPESAGHVRFADHLEDLRRVIAACDTPPVLVGHDLGGLLALHRNGDLVRAVVALAPLVPRTLARNANPALASLSARLAMWRSGALRPPRGRLGARYFGRSVPGGTIPDSGRLARELTGQEVLPRIGTARPTLILGGTRDGVSPPDAVRSLAQHLGATCRLVDGATHAMPWESGWEQRVSEVHRWLVHALGEELLAMRDEESD